MFPRKFRFDGEKQASLHFAKKAKHKMMRANKMLFIKLIYAEAKQFFQASG